MRIIDMSYTLTHKFLIKKGFNIANFYLSYLSVIMDINKYKNGIVICISVIK